MSADGQALFTVKVGASIDGLRDRPRTLAALEADLRRARAMGAPDDAVVTRSAPASTYLAEVIWVGSTERVIEVRGEEVYRGPLGPGPVLSDPTGTVAP